MIFYGWMRRPSILGIKLDQCQQCGILGPHALVRFSYWLHLFWVPLIFFNLRHVMACENCGMFTDIPLRQMRHGFRSGTLPLADRARPSWPQMQEEIWQQTGKRPSEIEVFDAVERNPHRGPFDLYVKLWPVLVAAVVVFAVAFPRQLAGVTGQPEQYGAAHTCWADSPNGSLVGCRLNDGTLAGRTGSAALTCYFDEPVAADAKTVCP